MSKRDLKLNQELQDGGKSIYYTKLKLFLNRFVSTFKMFQKSALKNPLNGLLKGLLLLLLHH